jgi:hypothetical protein
MDNPLKRLWPRKTSFFKNRDFVTNPDFLELAEKAHQIDIELASLQAKNMTLHLALYKAGHQNSKGKDDKKTRFIKAKLDAEIKEDSAKSNELIAKKNIIIEEIRKKFAPEINGLNPASALSQFYQK